MKPQNTNSVHSVFIRWQYGVFVLAPQDFIDSPLAVVIISPEDGIFIHQMIKMNRFQQPEQIKPSAASGINAYRRQKSLFLKYHHLK